MKMPPQELTPRQLRKEFALLAWCGIVIGAGAYLGWHLLRGLTCGAA